MDRDPLYNFNPLAAIPPGTYRMLRRKNGTLIIEIRCNSCLFTVAGEEKTVISSNLSVTCPWCGKEILAIHADKTVREI